MVISVLLDTSSEGQNRTLACSLIRQPRFFHNYVSFGPGSACDAIHNKSTSSSMVLEGGSWLFFGARLYNSLPSVVSDPVNVHGARTGKITINKNSLLLAFMTFFSIGSSS